MARIRFLAGALAIVAGGCGTHLSESVSKGASVPQLTPKPVSKGATVPELTPEAAKAALIELIRSGSTKDLEGFPLERYADDPAEKGEDRTASWGPFQIQLGDKTYSYAIRYGPPPKVCTHRYRGVFELRAGRWVALAPRVKSYALGSG